MPLSISRGWLDPAFVAMSGLALIKAAERLLVRDVEVFSHYFHRFTELM